MTDTFVAPELPIDSEGYCQSFLVSEEKELEEFFWKYGFVVVRDIIPPEYVAATRSDIFSLAGVDPTKPETWLHKDWKAIYKTNYNANKGFLGYDVGLSQAAWNNRQHPDVYKAFCTIFKQKDLWAKMDRFGFMRPTRDLLSNDTKVNKVEWETDRNWVHWDQNPWIEPKFCRVQALITLSDHTATSGGFHCIPGFTHYFKTWGAKNQDRLTYDCLINFSDLELKRKYTTKITMRAGSLLMWDSRTPHGNYPNEGSDFRIVQYTGMFPVPHRDRDYSVILKERRLEMKGMTSANNVSLSVLGKKIAGLIDYEEDEIGTPIINDSSFNRDQGGY